MAFIEDTLRILKANLRQVLYTKMKNIFPNPAIFEVLFISNLCFLSLSLERCLVHSSHRLWYNCGGIDLALEVRKFPVSLSLTFVFDLICTLRNKRNNESCINYVQVYCPVFYPWPGKWRLHAYTIVHDD